MKIDHEGKAHVVSEDIVRSKINFKMPATQEVTRIDYQLGIKRVARERNNL